MTLVVRVALVSGAVHRHAVDDYELAVDNVAIRPAVVTCDELVQHLFGSFGHKMMQCLIRATESDLAVLINIGRGKFPVSCVVIDGVCSVAFAPCIRLGLKDTRPVQWTGY